MKASVTVEKIPAAFVDKRGAITDLLNREISHVGLITTRKGAVRASHYHYRSYQYSYILAGSFEVLTAPVRTPGKITRHRLKAGDLISIAPRTIHLFRATSNATMIDMISLSRAGKGFEADVARVPFTEGAFVLPPKT